MGMAGMIGGMRRAAFMRDCIGANLHTRKSNWQQTIDRWRNHDSIVTALWAAW